MTQPNENWAFAIEFTDGVWTDLTARVESLKSPISISSGDTAEAVGDTGGMSVVLRNHDQALTPGNLLSPYSPNIEPNKRMKVTRTILDQVFEYIAYLQYPDIDAWTESTTAEPREQTITFSGVDRLARIGNSRKFVSTLAEHIKAHAGTAMRAYWPLNQTAGPLIVNAVGSRWAISEELGVHLTGAQPDDPSMPSIAYGSGDVPLGDDGSSILFTPSASSVYDAYVSAIHLSGIPAGGFSLSSGQVITMVGWINPDPQPTDNSTTRPLMLNFFGNAAIRVDFGGSMVGEVFGSGYSGTVTGPMYPYDINLPIALRFGYDPALLELWIGDDVYTDAMTVTVPAVIDFGQLRVGYAYGGSISHVQLYRGAESDWTHDDFLAQYEVGRSGLERQTSGERIRTILGYAGVPGSELGRIDDGVAVMQMASLRDKDPATALAEAVEAEQGLLYATGDGIPVFADRIRLLNI